MHGDPQDNWEQERDKLLRHRISDLGLAIEGTRVERLVRQLYDELAEKALSFMPPVYLSDQWGCPDNIPIIGVPFYLADDRLARIEDESSMGIEDDRDIMRYLRHEAGHAYNYAFRFYDRADWRRLFGPYSRPYNDRFRVDPMSRAYVRHILGWYAQKHPDEDFAETFAVWMTPGLDWRATYAGWPALQKLEYADKVLREVAGTVPEIPALTEDDLPVHAMHYTVAEHYDEESGELPVSDERHFDGDLRTLFGEERGQADTPTAAGFLRSHRRELVARVSYWTGESAATVRALVDFLATRAESLGLRAIGREATLLIEITAFATAVMMNFRYTHALDGTPDTSAGEETP